MSGFLSLEHHFQAARAAVCRADLRRKGVIPLLPRDPQRELLEDQLLEMVEQIRAKYEPRRLA